MKPNTHVVYRRYHKGQGKYTAAFKSDLGGQASGTFPTVKAVKQWGRQWAKAKRTSVTFEYIK